MNRPRLPRLPRTPRLPRLSRLPPLPLLLSACSLAGCSGPSAPERLAGYVEADLVYLAPAVAGTLQSVAVRRGDAVRRGELLYALEGDAETLARDAAQARSDSSAAQAADLRKGRRPLELKALDEQLAQARAALAASTATLARNRQLVQDGFVAALRLDELVAAQQRDAARVRELEADRAFAVQAGRSDAVAAAQAEARATQADLALAQWKAGQTRRQAPADAVVQDVMYRVGEWVPAGAPVVALLPPEALKLRFYLPEPMLASVAVGQEVQVGCDGCAAGLTARVSFISPQAEFTPPVLYGAGSRGKLVFLVEARPAAGSTLKPGQPVDVSLKAGR